MPIWRLCGGRCDERLAVEQDLARGRRLEAGEHHQRRRLARAGGSEQRQELAALDVEIEIVDDARRRRRRSCRCRRSGRSGRRTRHRGAVAEPLRLRRGRVRATIAQVSSSALPKQAIISSISASLMIERRAERDDVARHVAQDRAVMLRAAHEVRGDARLGIEALAWSPCRGRARRRRSGRCRAPRRSADDRRSCGCPACIRGPTRRTVPTMSRSS